MVWNNRTIGTYDDIIALLHSIALHKFTLGIVASHAIKFIRPLAVSARR